jgi:aryl-alcohol dehydrogenase-like predicted oxidoreductase
MMNRIRLGKSGLIVSSICLGSMYYGSLIDQKDAFTQMNVFAEKGGNFIDTANAYARWLPQYGGAGVSEKTIGRWLSERKNRSEIVVATKARAPVDGAEGLGRQALQRALEGSLRRLGTDYLDLYWAHWEDVQTPLEETLYTFDLLIRQGKVRYCGLSNHLPYRVMKALALSRVHGWAAPIAVQPQCSLAVRRKWPDFQVTFSPEYLRLCREEGLGVVCYSPLAAGFLTGKYSRDSKQVPGRTDREQEVRDSFFSEENFDRMERAQRLAEDLDRTVAQVALAWLINQTVPTVPIVGASTTEQLETSLESDQINLSAEQVQYLEGGRDTP